MASNNTKIIRFCFDCERIRPAVGRGLCTTCWVRRQRSGSLGERHKRPITVEFYKEYLMLRGLDDSMSHRQIAEKIGISQRTIDRFSAHRRGVKKYQCLVEVGL